MAEEKAQSLRDLVAEVSAAYFANSHVSVAEIGTVIAQIAQSLGAIGEASARQLPEPRETAPEPKLTPAQIRRSVTPDAIVSFEDGRPYKTLRRHLSVRGLTSEQYREKWGLPKDYPMVAPSYSARRSEMARQLGLGSHGPSAAAAPTRTGRRHATRPAADQ